MFSLELQQHLACVFVYFCLCLPSLCTFVRKEKKNQYLDSWLFDVLADTDLKFILHTYD